MAEGPVAGDAGPGAAGAWAGEELVGCCAIGGTGGADEGAGVIGVTTGGGIRGVMSARTGGLWPHGGSFWSGTAVLARIVSTRPAVANRSSGTATVVKWISTSPVRSAATFISLCDCDRSDRTYPTDIEAAADHGPKPTEPDAPV